MAALLPSQSFPISPKCPGEAEVQKHKLFAKDWTSRQGAVHSVDRISAARITGSVGGCGAGGRIKNRTASYRHGQILDEGHFVLYQHATAHK
jgi:hypothetical protein